MQSQNETCILTRLPIQAGEHIKLLLAAPAGKECRGRNRADGWWKPITLPLSGAYDGFGGIDGMLLRIEDMKAWSALELAVFQDGEAMPVKIPDNSEKEAAVQIRKAIRHAIDGQLCALVSDGAHIPEWRPAIVQIAKASYWDRLVRECAGMISDDEIRSVHFRLTLLGPLRTAARLLSENKAIEGAVSAMPVKRARELAAAAYGMTALRLSYGPCTLHSRSRLDLGWQSAWYRDLWLDAEAMARGPEKPVPRFLSACTWDGSFLQTNAGSGSHTASFANELDPSEKGCHRQILAAAVGSILDAIQIADRQADAPGGDEDDA